MVDAWKHEAFARNDRVVEGWYWALPSRELRRGKVKAVELLGRKLAVFRDKRGNVRALDARCPHMGAHLAEGRVDGEGLRCFFHGWRYDAEGRLDDIPCQTKLVDARVQSWPVAERYGLIWIYNARDARFGVPEVPELEGQDVSFSLGPVFEKGCHPNVVMVNAIDEQHFTTVHHLPVDLSFAVSEPNESTIRFDNQTGPLEQRLAGRLIKPFYKGPLTYNMCYRFGTNGTVTLGPDALHFHILFALRPTEDGRTEGRAVCITKKRRGVLGWLLSRVCLLLSRVVGGYFARGDTRVFETIEWGFGHPIPADHSIVRFIKHLEKQRRFSWRTWEGDSLVGLQPARPRDQDGKAVA